MKIGRSRGCLVVTGEWEPYGKESRRWILCNSVLEVGAKIGVDGRWKRNIFHMPRR